MKDYFKNYLKRIDAVTVADIKRVANKYLKPNNLNITVVGEGTEVGDKLARFGELHYIDREGVKTSAPIKSLPIPAGTTAKSVLQDYIKAIGGAEKIKSITSSTSIYSLAMQGMNLKVTNLFATPNKTSTSIEMEGRGVMQQMIFDGTSAFMKAQGQVIPLPEDQAKNAAIESYFIPELYYTKNGVKTELKGAKTVEGKSAYHIEANYPGGKILNLFYDMETGLKLKSSSTDKTPQGEFESSDVYGDYKAVNGVLIPHTQNSIQGPQKMDMKLESMEVNKPIDAKNFK